MTRRIFALLLTAFLVLVGGPALASPVTQTTTQKDLIETFVDVVPSCEGGGPLYEITTTSNAVEHETLFDDGRIHLTFTQTGKFVAEPLEAGLPSYTGSFTVWGGFNANGATANGTFTFDVRGKGSDGSKFVNSTVDHFNERPDGSVNAFFHCHD
jgi:hypothetical protein